MVQTALNACNRFDATASPGYTAGNLPVEDARPLSISYCDREKTTYTFTGRIKTKEKIHSSSALSASQTELYTYTYDDWGKLLKTEHKLNQNSKVEMASYQYDELGRLQRKGINNSTCFITYSYNIRDWLTSLQTPFFNENLYYNTGLGLACYNGNISSITWKAGQEGILRGYRFTYDLQNRLKTSTYGEGLNISQNTNRYNENIIYDKMGNIIHIQRYGKLNTSSFGLVDDLSLYYSGNQLKKVTDALPATVTDSNSMQFTDGTDSETEYAYDFNGNRISDLNKGIRKVDYNLLNLPQTIRWGQGDSTSYFYSTEGSKLQVKHRFGPVVSQTDYNGNVVYKNGSLSMIFTEEGYINPVGDHPVYHYFLQDHIGNNRVTLGEGNELKQIVHYYPFGAIMQEELPNNDQPFLYNKKELDRKGGLDSYDYGSRYYDPVLGSFPVMDKYCEKYYSLSPYQYAANNPVKNIDINGDSIWVSIEGSRYYYGSDSEGNYGLIGSNGTLYSGENAYAQSVAGALNQLRTGAAGRELVDDLAASSNHVTIRQTKSGNRALKGGRVIYWNQNDKGMAPNAFGGTDRPGYIGLAHEMAHVQDYWHGTFDLSPWVSLPGENGKDIQIPRGEIYATHVENKIRAEHGVPLRTHYGVSTTGVGIESTRILNVVKSKESNFYYSIFYNQRVPLFNPLSKKTDYLQGGFPYRY